MSEGENGECKRCHGQLEPDGACPRCRASREAYQDGLRAGIRMYAWWSDGTQYVGTCGTTLHEALDKIEESTR